MRVLATRFSAVSSGNETPHDELVPVWITSLFNTASPTRSVTVAPLRTTVTSPTTFATLPMASDAVAGWACAYCPGVGDAASKPTVTADMSAPRGHVDLVPPSAK